MYSGHLHFRDGDTPRSARIHDRVLRTAIIKLNKMQTEVKIITLNYIYIYIYILYAPTLIILNFKEENGKRRSK